MNLGYGNRLVRHQLVRQGIAPCAAAAIPLAITPGFLYFYDVTPKIVMLYCAVALTLPFVDTRRLLSSKSGRLLCGLLFAGFFSLLVSTLFSVRLDLSIFGTNWRRFGLVTESALLLFAFVVAADLSAKPERVRAYLRASPVATVLVALYGVFQYLGIDPWLDPTTYHVGTGEWTIVRPPGTLGYVTYFANYLVFGAFQGVALYRFERKGLWRWLALGVVALASIAIVLSGTRAAWLGLIAGGLVMWGLESRRLSTRGLFAIAGVAVIAIAFYVSPAGLQLRSRMRWFREDPAGGARLYLWRDSLRLVARHWAVGSGPDTFSIEFPQVQSRDLSRAFPEFYYESAHNVFLDAGTAQGLPGSVILLAAVVVAFRVKRSARKDVPALLAGLAAMLVCHQFSVFIVPTAIAFWITVAMLVSAESEPELETGVSSPNRRMLWLAPISVVLIVAAVRMTVGDRHLAAMRSALEAHRYQEANTEYLAAQRYGSHADLWYSRKLLIENQRTSKMMDSVTLNQQTLASALNATTTAEDSYNAWMNLGLVYARLGNAGRTEYSIRRAIEAAPNWYKPHLALAQLLVATNRKEEGHKELQLASDLNPNVPAHE